MIERRTGCARAPLIFWDHCARLAPCYRRTDRSGAKKEMRLPANATGLVRVKAGRNAGTAGREECVSGVHLTGANHSSLLEAFAAIDGPALRHLERNRGFFSALRADRSCHHTRAGVCGRSIRTRRSPLRLAVLAALRLIPKAFAGVEKLLARRENKFRPAVNTLKSLVFVFHPGSLSRSPASVLQLECDLNQR
jgi:hypothetical protein